KAVSCRQGISVGSRSSRARAESWRGSELSMNRFSNSGTAPTPTTGLNQGFFAFLTARERQIATFLLEPGNEKVIAECLRISPHTPHTHLNHMYRKLGVHSRIEAMSRLLGSPPKR